MNTWFFKIEGRSTRDLELNQPFGFFVNCIITTEKDIEDAKKWIYDDLKNDGLEIVKLEHSGKYQDFYWNEKELQQEFDKLAEEAEKKPEIIHYSDFHTWQK